MSLACTLNADTHHKRARANTYTPWPQLHAHDYTRARTHRYAHTCLLDQRRCPRCDSNYAHLLPHLHLHLYLHRRRSAEARQGQSADQCGLQRLVVHRAPTLEPRLQRQKRGRSSPQPGAEATEKCCCKLRCCPHLHCGNGLNLSLNLQASQLQKARLRTSPAPKLRERPA